MRLLYILILSDTFLLRMKDLLYDLLRSIFFSFLFQFDQVLAARKKIIEDDMWEEKDNQKIELATKLKKTQAVEEKVEVLVDPSALEEALARYRARCVELKTLKHKICKENATEKQAVLEEMNEFFKMYKEHEQYKIEKLNKLEKDVKSYDPLAIRLDQNDEDFISNL